MIPYSFIPGTKAKASEVNANFIALADKIDANKSICTEDISDINTTLSTKADKTELINEHTITSADTDLDDYTTKGTAIWTDKAVTTSAQRSNFTKIPNAADGSDYIHHMTASAGTTAREQILVTLSFNYSGTVDQTANAGKTLTGTLTLKQENCS